jgi:anti-sigma-K factor RskA
MSNADDIDGLAAEYAVGSLDALERREVAARRKVDATLDAAIRAWENRLGALSDAVPKVEPPPGLFLKIARELWRPAAEPVRTAKVSSRAIGTKRWVAITAAACALAACLAAVIVWRFQDSPAVPARLMAELLKSAKTVDGKKTITVPLGFVVQFDLRASTMIISPLAVPPGSRRDYQLWLVPNEPAPPISLGVISLAEPSTSPWIATYPPSDLVHATLAVSLEPPGGSPKGIPTGPTMFAGKLVQIMP